MGVKASLATGLLGSLSLTRCRSRRTGARPNVIVITLDTTRRDRLGCYGCGRPISPNLDRFAGESLLYTRLIAPSNWTLPSHASLFTGKFTASHGARFDPEGPLCLAGEIKGSKKFWKHFRARGLSPDEQTLASILKDAGYATGAVAAGPWLKRAFGLQKGFDHYDDRHIDTAAGRLASQVTPPALDWVKEVRDRPFFLFVNYFDPHYPYHPPLEYANRFMPEELKTLAPKTDEERRVGTNALYDGEIAFMDHHVGLLLAGLGELGVYDDSLIIAVSDHGEMLGEHGRFGHGHRLYQEEIHVPMLVKHPRGEIQPGRTDDPVQLTDILPMILHRLGAAVPPGVQGGLPPRVGHPIVAEIHTLEFLSQDGDSRALLEGDFKYLWNSKGAHALFDLAADHREEVNLVDREPERAKSMEARLNGFLGALPRPRPAEEEKTIDKETEETLRSLQYIR